MNRRLTAFAVEKEIDIIQAINTKYGSQAGYNEFIGEFELESGELLYAGLKWYDVVNYLKTKHRYEVNYSRMEMGS